MNGEPLDSELGDQLLKETEVEINRDKTRPDIDPLLRAMQNDAIVGENPPAYDGDPTELDLPSDDIAGD